MEVERSIETEASSPVANKAKKETTTTIRVSEKTKRRIEALVKRANTKSFGKRVKADAVITQALVGFTDTDMKVVQTETISGKDRFEALYRERGCRKRGIDRDEFLTEILQGKIPFQSEN